VLRGAYKLPCEGVITAIEWLLAIRHLHLARSEGCGAMLSFDQKLAQMAGQLNLQPRVESP